MSLMVFNFGFANKCQKCIEIPIKVWISRMGSFWYFNYEVFNYKVWFCGKPCVCTRIVSLFIVFLGVIINVVVDQLAPSNSNILSSLFSLFLFFIS